MGSLNRKEKEFKEVVSQFEFDIDTSQIWSNVAPKLVGSKDRDRLFGFLWFTGIVLVLVLGIYINYNQTNTIERSGILADQKEIFHTQEIAKNHQDDDIATSTRMEEASFLEASKQGNSIETNELTKEKLSSNTINEVSTVGSETNRELIRNNLRLNNSKKLNANKVEFKNSDAPTVNNALGSREEGPSNLGKLLDKAANLPVLDHENDGDDLIMGSIGALEITFLERKVWPILNWDGRSNTYKLPENSAIQPMIDSDKKSLKMIYAIRTGINKSISKPSLMSTSSEFDSGQFAKENGLWGTSTAIIAGLENRQGWKLFGGLTYSNQTSVYRNFSTESYTTDIDGQSQRIDANGLVVDVPVTLTETTTVYSDVNRNRRHRYLDLTIGMSKTIMQFGSVVLDADMSVLYNLNSSHSGYFFDELSNSITIFSKPDKSVYKSNTLWAAQVGLNLEWRINQFGIGVSPFFKIRPNSIIENSNFYEIKDNLVGIQLSLSLRPF